MSGEPGGRDLAARTAELAALLPALAAALQRDSAPGSSRGVLSCGGVVNPDVLHAIIMVRAEVPAACARACALTGEPWHRRPLGTCLRALPRFAGRLEAIGMPGAANRLDADAARWLRIAKLALGLRTPDVPIGFGCPLHDDPSPLVMLGSEGFVRGDGTVAWAHDGRIWCRQCDETWPVWQWRHLGRMLASA